MDYVKVGSKYAVDAGVLLGVLYAINMYIAPMSQGYVAVIPIDLASIFSVFVSLFIATAAVDWLRKNLLGQWM